MTVVSQPPAEPTAGLASRRNRQLRRPDASRWPLAILLAGFGLLFAAAGLALRGSTWILPDGLLGGGIALVVCAPIARSMLEPLVVSSPFMFYTLSPVGGILTVGSSDALLPIFVFLMLAGAAVARGRRVHVPRPPVPAAMPLIVLTVLLCTASTVLWTVLSPDFLAARSIADTVKLAAGVGYLIVVFVLVRRVGMEGALRSFRLWGWTATALSLGSLAGITGAVEIIPSDGYRSLGYFQDANLYAGYLLVSLSVLIFLGTVTAKSSPWLPVQAVVILGGIITTGSRGGMLSLALLVGFATLIINSARLRLMVLAGVGQHAGDGAGDGQRPLHVLRGCRLGLAAPPARRTRPPPHHGRSRARAARHPGGRRVRLAGPARPVGGRLARVRSRRAAGAGQTPGTGGHHHARQPATHHSSQ